MIIWGSNITVSHSTITDTGWNPAITWGKHGIYDKGPNTTIANNDFAANAGGQAISLRFHGAHVYGNTIHDTPYGIAFFDYDTAPGPQGTDYIYDNRLWNISGYGFYYSGETDPQGNPPTVGFVLASNTFQLTSGSEAVNVSEIPAGASATLANNIFTGSYGSAYRGCATCSEYNNDWYGGSSNIPSGSGDLHVNPSLSAAAAALTPAAGSAVIDAGTTAVPGLSYVAACDGAPLHYCGARPDQGSAESTSGTAPAVTPPPPSGPSGTSGASGASGPSGASGTSGPSGASGASGATRCVGRTGRRTGSPAGSVGRIGSTNARLRLLRGHHTARQRTRRRDARPVATHADQRSSSGSRLIALRTDPDRRQALLEERTRRRRRHRLPGAREREYRCDDRLALLQVPRAGLQHLVHGGSSRVQRCRHRLADSDGARSDCGLPGHAPVDPRSRSGTRRGLPEDDSAAQEAVRPRPIGLAAL